MNKFKINPLVLAIAVAMPTTVFAQAQDGQIDEIVVSGFRASQAKALDIKRESTGAVDSIVAEDMGKFPDNNLADSMARLPGVNIDRTGGEGKTISVRGLSPDFSRVRVNGMETIATGYGNKNRTFDFNIFASELFSRIDVHKTMAANLEEGSLGATVDLQTAHPLDSKKDTFVVGVSGGYNDQSETFDPRFVALGSMQNEEGTFGVSLSVAMSNRNVNQIGHDSGRWEANGKIDPTKTLASQANHWKLTTPAKTAGNLCSATLTAGCWNDAAFTMYKDTVEGDKLNGAFHPRFPRQMDRDIEIDRLGVTGSIQWKPTDDTSLTLDILHADLGYKQHDINLTPISLSRTTATGRAQTTVNSYTYNADTNVLSAANLSGVDVRSENYDIDADTGFDQYSLQLDHHFTDALSVKVLLGTSKSKTDVTHETTTILEAFDKNMSYDYTGDAYNPVISYGFDLTSPSNWQISELRDRPAVTENTFDNAAVDFKWEVNDIFTLEAGASAKKFSFDIASYRRDSAIIDQAKAPQGSAVKMPAGCTIAVADLAVTDALGATFAPSNTGANAFFLGNTSAVFDKIGYYNNDTCFPLTANTSDTRAVEEKDTGYYTQLDFKTDIGAMPFRGDVGVRTVNTDVDSTGILTQGPVTVSRSYSDTLPSVNLALEPIENVTVRASWAKVMSRPTLGNLTPGGTLDNFNRKYTAGNPGLNPFRATAKDVSVEWYFAEESLLSLAVFQKDIESFPQKSITTVKYSDLGLALDPSPATVDSDYLFTSTGNGAGGKLDGWEVQYQQPFNFGPDWLKDFGIKLNYTDVTSKVNIGTPEAPVWAPLVGQSDSSYNGTLWYEHGAFEGRVSYTYRSDYLTSSNTASVGGPGFDRTAPVGVVDASFSYAFNDNLKLKLDLLNLTNEAETTLISDNELVGTSFKAGTQVYAGVLYTF
jgi:TonB-dependent receptor